MLVHTVSAVTAHLQPEHCGCSDSQGAYLPWQSVPTVTGMHRESARDCPAELSTLSEPQGRPDREPMGERMLCPGHLLCTSKSRWHGEKLHCPFSNPLERGRKGRFDLFVGFRIWEFRTKAEFQRRGSFFFFSSMDLFYEFKSGPFISY